MKEKSATIELPTDAEPHPDMVAGLNRIADKNDPWGRDSYSKNIMEASGNVMSDDALVLFLYLLARDHLPIGTIEKMLRYVSEHPGSYSFTNGWLAEWAKYSARTINDRLFPVTVEFPDGETSYCEDVSGLLYCLRTGAVLAPRRTDS